MLPTLDIRHYLGEHPRHQHAFTQLVLPICGRMDIEVEGRGAQLDSRTAAVVAAGAAHAQSAEAHSRFLILDCPPTWLPEQNLAPLARQLFVPIAPAARHLIEFADLTGSRVLPQHAGQLAPLLLAALGQRPAAMPCSFERLLARVQANPQAQWSNSDMARLAGLGLSQLHLRFRERFATSPQAWLASVRLQRARQWLTESDLPIAEIALRSGYSDQAALTRAMSRVEGVTPAALRRSLGKDLRSCGQ
ncbi:AraC family transcriptional regulator [Pseudomonas sp. DTU_2021_1001937_2_SI_NGA_ILE_001]|uniref:AraC family transcriptional regulator n=1 Tax=Pseudomonas sp. DTU_2021_1001937_2_SI_NGA_ILE_001 TaxID=3077589 RepID=UPI0028FC1A0A|nr:AraC family transcriptional regulator [Pseudomonas sp. DTU_2021_1001937_2_SI_NGA_ILE_001]WNW11603.1 AraC family transcriptional regulator [Pseudomonas sp. DTU_2021_1001937_2_SI_NGA_ILE_001]